MNQTIIDPNKKEQQSQLLKITHVSYPQQEQKLNSRKNSLDAIQIEGLGISQSEQMRRRDQKIFEKHKRFSMHLQENLQQQQRSQNQQYCTDKINKEEVKLDSALYCQQQNIKQSQFKKRKRHHKYKYQSHTSQLQRVPQAPTHNNTYYFDHPLQQINLGEVGSSFNNNFQPASSLFPLNGCEEVGAGMNFLINDFGHQSSNNEAAPTPTATMQQQCDFNFFDSKILKEGVDSSLNLQTTSSLSYSSANLNQNKTHREQMLDELRSQKQIIERLITQIKEQDDKISELNGKFNEQKVSS